MYVCTECDIVHLNSHCPCCEAKDKISDLEQEIENLENKVSELLDELDAAYD
jgi:uncharacterized protein YceH (UPF0502 family)